jgi:hypothetical protein
MKRWFNTAEAAMYVGYAVESLEKMRKDRKGSRFRKLASGAVRYESRSEFFEKPKAVTSSLWDSCTAASSAIK